MNIKNITLAAFIAIMPIAATAQDYTPEQMDCAVAYFSSGEFASVRNTHDLLEVGKDTGSMNLALAAATCVLKDPSISKGMDGFEAMMPAIAVSTFEPTLTAFLKADEDKMPFIRLPRDRTLWIDTLKAWGEENPEELEELSAYMKTIGADQ